MEWRQGQRDVRVQGNVTLLIGKMTLFDGLYFDSVFGKYNSNKVMILRFICLT